MAAIAMSDTFFTTAPHWRWLVIWYLFVGGVAGGSYLIGALLDLFGDARDQPLARLAYYVAFPAVLAGGVLLILDLSRPERFWHMLVMSERGWPVFKWWSPMSVGSWGLAVLGGFTFLSFVGALAEDGRLRWRGLVLLRRGVLGAAVAIVGGIFGFFLAGYTGVLLAVTNRPILADSPLLGLLFLVSAASVSAAVMVLIGLWRGVAAYSIRWLSRMDGWLMPVELIVLVAFVASLGPVAQVWLSWWGVALAVGVVLLGIVVPLLLHWRPRILGGLSMATAAALAVVGGFVLRVVVVLASESV
jgi:formate-dependent nitrite reductase membrane component NrfD